MGFKVKVSELVGIRLQGRLLVPVTFVGTSMWCGTGGCAMGIGSYATLVQGDFSGGLIFYF